MKKIIYFLGLLVGVAFLAGVAFVFKDFNLDFKASMRPVRWGALAVFVMYYPVIVDFYGKRKSMDEEQIIEAKSKQIKIAILLVGFEILIVENVLGGLI